MTPIPLDLGTPKSLDFYKNLTTIPLFGHVVILRKFNSPFHSLGGGGIKSVKLAPIYIEVRVEGYRTTPVNQSRAIRKTCRQDLCCFICYFALLTHNS